MKNFHENYLLKNYFRKNERHNFFTKTIEIVIIFEKTNDTKLNKNCWKFFTKTIDRAIIFENTDDASHKRYYTTLVNNMTIDDWRLWLFSWSTRSGPHSPFSDAYTSWSVLVYTLVCYCTNLKMGGQFNMLLVKTISQNCVGEKIIFHWFCNTKFFCNIEGSLRHFSSWSKSSDPY